MSPAAISKLFIPSLCILVSVPASAQLGKDSASVFLAKAGRLVQSARAPELKRADDLARRAHELGRRRGDRNVATAALSFRAWLAGLRGEYPRALKLGFEGLQTLRPSRTRTTASLLQTVGMAYQSLGERETSLVYFDSAFELHERLNDIRGGTRVLLSASASLRELSQYDSALAVARLALRRAQTLKEPDGLSSVEGVLGTIFTQARQLDSALVHLFMSRSYSAKDPNARGSLSITYNDIGLIYSRLHRTDSALVYFDSALVIAREVGDSSNVPVILRNIGELYATLREDPQAAERYLQDALARFEQQGDVWNAANTLYVLGSLKRDHHSDTQGALADFNRAFDLVGRNSKGVGPAAIRIEIGATFLDLHQVDSAVAYTEEAREMLSESNDPYAQALVFRNLGNIFRAPGLRQDLEKASIYYDSASMLLEFVRRVTGSDANAVSFADPEQDLYANWALTLYSRGVREGFSEAALQAFTAVERGRARGLVDVLSHHRPREPLPDAPAESVGAEFAALRRQRVHVLSYLATEDTLLVWSTADGNRLSITAVPVARDSLVHLVEALQKSIETAPLRGAVRRAAPADVSDKNEQPGEHGAALSVVLDELGRFLLPTRVLPDSSATGELLIITTGFLSVVPFAALPVPGGTRVGLHYPLRYAPSLEAARLLRIESDQSGRRTLELDRRRRALFAADPELPPRFSGLPRLSQARTEVVNIASSMGADSLTASAATETSVRARLATAPVIHLATHGLASDDGLGAFLVLAPDRLNDGLFTMAELLRPSLPRIVAELVVLSACQSGLGTIREAEGTMGLQRAFLAKGAQSVLVSLWRVDDGATRLLMETFYREWLDEGVSRTKPQALLAAARAVAETPGFADPRYWAAFQLIGNP